MRGPLVSYPLAAVPISSVADGRRGVSTKFRDQDAFLVKRAVPFVHTVNSIIAISHDSCWCLHAPSSPRVTARTRHCASRHTRAHTRLRFCLNIGHRHGVAAQCSERCRVWTAGSGGACTGVTTADSHLFRLSMPTHLCRTGMASSCPSSPDTYGAMSVCGCQKSDIPSLFETSTSFYPTSKVS